MSDEKRRVVVEGPVRLEFVTDRPVMCDELEIVRSGVDELTIWGLKNGERKVVVTTPLLVGESLTFSGGGPELA
jgi:hypothetical protein